MTMTGEGRFGPDLVFGLAFRTIGRGLGRFALLFLLTILAGIVVFGTLGIVWMLTVGHADLQAGLRQHPAFWILAALGLLVYLLAMVAIHLATVGSAYALMRGRPVSLSALFGLAWQRLWPAIGTGILAMLGILVGLALFIVPGLILLVRWWVWAPACLVEGHGSVAALKRSAALTRGRRWTVFWLVLITLLVAGALNQIADVLVEVQAGFAILSVLIYGFTTTFWSVLVAAIYVGLRDRAAQPAVPDLVMQRA